jgi:hypothetical protein
MDNWVNLDIGLNLKIFDGEVSTVDSTNTTTRKIKIDETIPLPYLSARLDLPFSGTYMGADINGLSIDGSRVVDATIKLGYESDIGVLKIKYNYQLIIRASFLNWFGNTRENMITDGKYFESRPIKFKENKICQQKMRLIKPRTNSTQH